MTAMCAPEMAAVCANCGKLYINCTCPKWIDVGGLGFGTRRPAQGRRTPMSVFKFLMSALCNRCGKTAPNCTCPR